MSVEEPAPVPATAIGSCITSSMVLNFEAPQARHRRHVLVHRASIVKSVMR